MLATSIRAPRSVSCSDAFDASLISPPPVNPDTELLSRPDLRVAAAGVPTLAGADHGVERPVPATIPLLPGARTPLRRLQFAIANGCTVGSLGLGMGAVFLAMHGDLKLAALAILVRLPEVGRLSRAEVAALSGLAPYDDDSGERAGARHIAGGRARLRRAVYAAALPAAFKWNPQIGALYRRLIAKGKPHKCALVACARKLIIYVNTVVERQTPWRSAADPAPA